MWAGVRHSASPCAGHFFGLEWLWIVIQRSKYKNQDKRDVFARQRGRAYGTVARIRTDKRYDSMWSDSAQESPGGSEKRSAVSLRIETFEGRRPRLRRTRQAMGVQSSRTSQGDCFWCRQGSMRG